ncbi:MAG: gluconate:H+ symporter [Pseudomonadota bacterium]
MELIAEYRAVIATLAGIAVLLGLILRARMNAFAALMIIAIGSALAAGMSPEHAFNAVRNGMGGTLGFIAPIIGLGALFGAILESSGGLRALAASVSRVASATRQKWLMGGLGIVAATPVFFDVALIVLMPMISALSKRTGVVALGFGLPLCAGLAVGHAFIPPTPGPIAIAELIGADLGWVILFGAVTGLISMAIAGPIWAGVLARRGLLPSGNLHKRDRPEEAMIAPAPLAGRVLFLIFLPLVLILFGTLASLVLPDGIAKDIITVVGHPFSALLIASGAVFLLLRPRDEAGKVRMRDAIEKSFEPTGIVILVTGAGGAFKQVLVDTGAGDQLAQMTLSLGLTPILAGYVLALLIRLAQGSATVAMITAAGLAAPIVSSAGLNAPQLGLMTIAIAAGATGLSHVNDSGFWLVGKLFGINEQETLRTWTVSTGLISVSGLVVCSILFLIVG